MPALQLAGALCMMAALVVLLVRREAPRLQASAG